MQQLKKRTNNSYKLDIYILISALVFLSSCGGRREVVSREILKQTTSPDTAYTAKSAAQETTQDEHRTHTLKLCEAKWPDMPLVFTTEQIDAYAEESSDARSCLFKMTTCKPCEQLYEFYKQEMERAGWQLLAICEFSSHRLFVYDKPYKTAFIKFRSKEDTKTQVECLITLKDIAKLQEDY